MALTMAEANVLLEKVSTPEELRELISRLDVTGSGSTTKPCRAGMAASSRGR